MLTKEELLRRVIEAHKQMKYCRFQIATLTLRGHDPEPYKQELQRQSDKLYDWLEELEKIA